MTEPGGAARRRASSWMVAAVEAPAAAARKQGEEALERLEKAIANLRRAGEPTKAEQAAEHFHALARLFGSGEGPVADGTVRGVRRA